MMCARVVLQIARTFPVCKKTASLADQQLCRTWMEHAVESLPFELLIGDHVHHPVVFRRNAANTFTRNEFPVHAHSDTVDVGMMPKNVVAQRKISDHTSNDRMVRHPFWSQIAQIHATRCL